MNDPFGDFLHVVWRVAAIVIIAASAVIGPILWWELRARSAERQSIKPGVLIDSHGNRFQPTYICARGSCFWALERQQ